MKTQNFSHGSTLLLTTTIIALISIIAGVILFNIGLRYQASFHSSSWQEALNVAESGADVGMSALNASITSPSTAWTAWTPPSASTFPKTYAGTFPAHSGDGNRQMYASVTIDNAVKDSAGSTWYRIRSTGTTTLPGPARVTFERSLLTTSGVKNHESILRKLCFGTDRTGGALKLPQVSRTIEIVAAPPTVSIFARSLLVRTTITMSGGAYTDSFNSTNPAESTNGQYDPAKRQEHGDIATISTGSSSNLMSSYVYGNASSNGGVFQNDGNVQGTVYNNFSTTISPVSNPSFSTTIATPTTVYNPGAPVTLTAGTSSAPANYVLGAVNISNGQNPLILAAPTPGQDSYINIWVTGDITTSGSGYIKQMPGVHAHFYVNGDVTVSGSAFDNLNGYASYLEIDGVTASDGSSRKYTVSGSANFVGVVNAPSYNFTLSGGGNFMGALIMNSANISGAAGFHYDEALSGGSSTSSNGFTVASWVEDTR